ILSGAGIHAISNIEKCLGRPDIIIEDRNKKQCIVIEIKRTRSKNNLDSIAEKAIHQIKVKKYVEGVPQSFASVLAYGIAFWKKECVVKMLRYR
ncbi:MAG: PD-(D/E)XK nuclease domain-containing protein, partial [Desulfovibrio sp.]|nr:PD-(D/E)XK nuclease domain-containing protein [Desulfovibrio sp.]